MTGTYEKRCDNSFFLRVAEQHQIEEARPETLRTRNRDINGYAIDLCDRIVLWNTTKAKLSHME